MRSVRRFCFAVALSSLAACAAAPFATAGPLVASAGSCAEQSLDRPFVPWLDLASYVPAPGGDFEDGGEGWSLSDAAIVPGNEPFLVGGPDDANSLEIGPGGSAQSPSICVGIEHPTLRLFARRSGYLLGSLTVEVLFEDAAGEVHSLPIGVLLGHSSWDPTLPLPVVASLLPLLPGERTAVAFRFTASAGASWTLDDVYVDPYRK